MLGGTFDESAGRSESEIRPRVRLHPATLEEKKMRLERDRRCRKKRRRILGGMLDEPAGCRGG